MNKQEIRDKFEANVAYLRRNIPPDDIYMFAEQTLMATIFFIHKWSDCEETEVILDDPIAVKWLGNILGFLDARDKGQDLTLDLDLKSVDEDNP